MDGDSLLNSPLVDFVTSVAVQGNRGADRVVIFLRELGILPADGKIPADPVRLPAELLLGLDQALRFAHWEQCGILLHVQAGLPPGEELLSKVLELQQGPDLKALVDGIAIKSIVLFWSLAWSVGVELQADLAIDGEIGVDAIADFLWQHRHDLETR